MSKKKKDKTFLAISAAFIGLMLTFSAVLYLANDEPVRTDSLDAKTGPNYSLEDLDVGNVREGFSPLGMVFENDDMMSSLDRKSERDNGNQVDTQAALSAG